MSPLEKRSSWPRRAIGAEDQRGGPRLPEPAEGTELQPDAEADGHDKPATEQSFLLVLLRALAAWSV